MLGEPDDAENKTPIDKVEDDCCLDILRRLRLDDLSARSQTCSEEPSDEMKRFDKSIRSVVLCGDDSHTNLDALNEFYADEEMAGVIEEVHFKQWRSLNGVGLSLVDMLKSVESIVIDNATIDEDLYDCILKYAPHLKHLSLRNVDFSSTDWMAQRYERLESLEWHSQLHDPDADKMKFMLDTNPNIKRFSLLCTNADCIDQLMEKDVKIDELFLHLNPNRRELTSDDIQFNYSMNILMKLAPAQHLKLHLMISKGRSIWQLGIVRCNVIGLLFTVSIDDVLATMHTFENLRYLRIEASNLPLAYFDMITKMPNLTELYIDRISGENFEIFHETVLAAAGELVKLTKIFLNGCTEQLTKIDFWKMDQQRMDLLGATHLMICIDSKELFTSFSSKFSELKMIEFVAAETEPSNYPFFRDVNALIGQNDQNIGDENKMDVNDSRVNDAPRNNHHPADTWENWRCSQPDWPLNVDNCNLDKANDDADSSQNDDADSFADDWDDQEAGPSGIAGASTVMEMSEDDWEDSQEEPNGASFKTKVAMPDDSDWSD